jgi:Domain of unknown function (DUF5671)
MPPKDHSKLLEYITESKAHGASDEFLVALLTRRGWPADDVYGTLGEYWASVTGLSVPERKGSGESARDAFLYLLSFATLATWACALGSMLFALIDYWLPDPVNPTSPFELRSSITWQMASVAVAFPIYLIAMRLVVRETAQNPDRLQSGVRKWLTYIALLGTAGTMVGDLIWFLDEFLGGDLTLPFVLKSLTVLGICAAIFIYYLGSLGRNSPMLNKLFAGLAGGAVVITFCVALTVAGTPALQRLAQTDIRRTQDLQRLAAEINTWYRQNSRLPASLSDLKAIGGDLEATDPITKSPYSYHTKTQTTYQLCASFATKTNTKQYKGFWDHGMGETCYTLDGTQVVFWRPQAR